MTANRADVGVRPGRSPISRTLLYAVLGIWSLICLFPVYWLVIVSLTAPADIDHGPHYLPFIDFWPSLEAWRFILADPYENLLMRFFNSVVIAVSSACLAVLTGSMVVYGLTRFRLSWSWATVGFCLIAICMLTIALFAWPGAVRKVSIFIALVSFLVALLARSWSPRFEPGQFLGLLLATRILPPIAIAVPLYVMAWHLGSIDTRYFLILTYAAIKLPVAIWLLMPVLGMKTSEQEEAAQLDGASHARIFLTITLPMVMGSVAAIGLLVFVLSWNEYLFATVLATDHAMTLPPWAVGQLSMKEAQAGGEAEEWAHLSAATVFMVLPLLGFTAVVQRALSKRRMHQQ